MTARIPESVSAWLVDWSIVTAIKGCTTPPRDPDDDDDEEEEEDDELEPAVVREPDE